MSANESQQSSPGRQHQTTRPDGSKRPNCTDHAKLRWLQRGSSLTTNLGEAWNQGFHVGGVSRGGTARLHPPTKTILIEADGHIVTVLHSEYTSYTDDHLVVCQVCNLKYQPTRSDRSCLWCGYDGEEDGAIQADDSELA